MDGERGWFIENDDGVVFVDQAHAGIDGRFYGLRLEMEAAFAGRGVDDEVSLWPSASTKRPEAQVASHSSREMCAKTSVSKFDERLPVVRGRDFERPAIFVRFRAGQRIVQGEKGGVALRPHFRRPPPLRDHGDTDRIRLAHSGGSAWLAESRWGLADETLLGIRFTQGGIHAHALIEDESTPHRSVPAAFLEVFQDSAIELEDAAESLALHVGAGFFAADPAGAKHDDGLVLHLLEEGCGPRRETAGNVRYPACSAAEGSELHLVVVAVSSSVTGRPSSSHCLSSRAWSLGEVRRAGSMPSTPKAMISFLIRTIMRVKGLGRAIAAILGSETFQPGNAVQFFDQFLDRLGGTGHEQIDAFRAEQDRCRARSGSCKTIASCRATA